MNLPIGLSTLVNALGWAIGFTAAAIVVVNAIDPNSSPDGYATRVLFAAGGGLIAGMLSGVAFREFVPELTWRRVGLLGATWAAIFGVFVLFLHLLLPQLYVFYIFAVIIATPVAGIVGGWFLARAVHPYATPLQEVLISLTWGLALVVMQWLPPLAFNTLSLSAGMFSAAAALAGAVGGTLGFGLTLWQLRRGGAWKRKTNKGLPAADSLANFDIIEDRDEPRGRKAKPQPRRRVYALRLGIAGALLTLTAAMILFSFPSLVVTSSVPMPTVQPAYADWPWDWNNPLCTIVPVGGLAAGTHVQVESYRYEGGSVLYRVLSDAGYAADAREWELVPCGSITTPGPTPTFWPGTPSQ